MDVSIAEFLAEQEAAVTATPPHIAFDAAEYAARLTKLQTAMREDGIDTLILSSPEAQNWLHGLALRWYKSQSPTDWRPLTTTVVRQDAGYILFEGIEHQEMIRRTSIATDVRLLPRYERSGMLRFIITEITAMGWVTGSHVGVELYSSTPNPAVSEMTRGALMEAGAIVVDATLTARRVRRTKSPAEINCIREAARICDAGLTHLANVLQPGMTELEAHGELIKGLSNAGGEPAGLHQVVAVGSGALSTGHEISGRRVLRPGDLIEVDACGVFKHYHSNRNRMFMIGEPDPAAFRLQSILAGAFDVLISEARPGVRVGDVNRALYEYYQDAGIFEMNTNIWIGGYEMGIAFPPDWVGEWKFTVVNGQHDNRTFEEGLVTNFESMCGLSLIDTVIYSDDGTETLSQIPYELAIVEA